MTARFDAESLRKAIDAMLITYPELAEDEQLRADVLEAETDIDTVLSRLVSAAADAATMQDAIKAHIQALQVRIRDLQAREARYKRQEDAMRQLMAGVLDRASLTKFTLPEATLSVSFRKPAPIISDETALPEECTKVVRKPDMAVIKAWCEAGNVPEGVTMSNGSTVLTIRSK